MPFTFSHPAAILPLRMLPARYYSFTGLIVGSMTPDFEYFIRMMVGSLYSHTIPGIFYFDLPVGIIICFLFHDIVRNDLIDHLPVWLQKRFCDLKTFNWNSAFKRHWTVIVLSILIGAASHIFWDDFTHPLGYFVVKSAFLQHPMLVAGYRFHVYNLLQSLSSLIGGIIVLSFIRQMPETKLPMPVKKDRYWLFVTMIVVMIMAIRFACGLTLHKYGNVVVSSISAFFIALIILPLVRKRVKWEKLVSDY
jgi:Domain of unknown function (DUF4184)